MPDAVLEILRGQMKGRRFALKEGTSLVIGRSPDADLHVPDRHVSRFHCRLENQSEGVLLLDTGSFNGTRVNGELVKKRVLQERDAIGVGNHEIIVRYSESDHDGVERGNCRPPRVRIDGERPPLEFTVREKYVGSVVSLSGGMRSSAREEVWQWMDAYCALAARTHQEQGVVAVCRAAVSAMVAVPGVKRGAVVLQDSRTLALETVACHAASTDRNDLSEHSVPGEFVVNRSVVEETLKSGESTICRDPVDARGDGNGTLEVEKKLRGILCVPLKVGAGVVGVLYADSGEEPKQFSEQDLRMMAAIGHQAGAALDRLELIEDLEALFLSTVRTMAAAIEAKDPYVRGHSERVTAYALMLADELEVSRVVRDVVELTGLLHDVGKIGVPERVLLKPGPLSDEDWSLLKLHPEAGVAIVRNLEHCDRMVRIPDLISGIRHHHERYDGTGYPARLKGKEIPLVARILAVADTFDAITSDRVYRKGRDGDAAMRVLEANAGTQFEPELVVAFRRAHDRGETLYPELVPGRFHKTRTRDTLGNT